MHLILMGIEFNGARTIKMTDPTSLRAFNEGGDSTGGNAGRLYKRWNSSG